MQEAPFSIQIELVEGCNLFCSFCGIRGIKKHKLKDINYMDKKTVIKIAKEIKKSKWNPRIEFAMHGEPTLHPSFFKMIKLFRKFLPTTQLMLTTNGYIYFINENTEELINKTFNSGMNIIAIDDYGLKGTYRIRKRIEKTNLIKKEYPQEKQYSPHKRYPKNTNLVIFIQNITKATKGGHSIINNHCGCAKPPVTSPLKKRCAKPFRELSIRWDGNVSVCCNDWRGLLPINNINKVGVVKLWNSKIFNSIRKNIYNYNRDFIPCDSCDAISYRVGLLPDKQGKEKLDAPNERDELIIKQNNKKGPLTNIIKRKWER